MNDGDVIDRSSALALALPHGRLVAGTGIDVCEIPRIADAIRRHGSRFVERLFHPLEIRRDPSSPAYPEHIAGLFAAKEAAMKALGTGMRGVSFREIAIVRQPGGPPMLALLGRARTRGTRLGVAAAHVSITHGREIAAAIVTLLREDGP
ncbi:MAG: Holo-[acyl-carrier-protein] synthase [Thermoanaerobaculia bacterium]|nr:Holo-[acyl-carrier-protein] synthase [Thermoanaerobaculia bacterium]